ncbi:MAG TPA: glycosyl hydrolase family 65 protein [Candidatus Krumholzibacteria bacterium]|nr:glycosyl hydrolase family 65 protein [Candidatus Krumholzibacteria bacterium]
MTEAWTLRYRGFVPEEEGLREALTTLGNGYFATRGALAESRAGEVHYPGTYLAGGYDRLVTEIADHEIENEDLVNFPDWTVLRYRIAQGDWIDPEDMEIVDHEIELDLRAGVLARWTRFRDAQGRETELRQRRLVHMEQPHLAAIESTVIPLNWSGDLEVRSAIDAGVVNDGVARYRRLDGRHLEIVETTERDESTVRARVVTRQSRLVMVQAARTRIVAGEGVSAGRRRGVDEDGLIGLDLGSEVRPDAALHVEKVVALTTSRDHASTECGQQADLILRRAGSFEDLLGHHRRAWEQLWRRFDVGIEHPDESAEDTDRIVHLYLFHLLQTVSPHTTDLDVGVPSRGWHGEAYRGHVFWDELFVFPLLNLRLPEITRSLLMYRYRRLGEARAAAARAGYRGALYPWQSGSNGREESQRLHLNPRSGRWIPDHSHLQYHVNAAIAYNVWQHAQVSGDHEFMCTYGVEMLLEIARFWASVATWNPELERYEILGVMGPDEYHDAYPGATEPGLDNNTYTNVMAAWGLGRALDAFENQSEVRQRELCETLTLDEAEFHEWRRISERLRVVFHEDGIPSQFEGYEGLKEFDWEGYRERYGDIQRLDRILESEDDTPNRYKASKQADVLMLFYLFSSEELVSIFDRLGYGFDPEDIPRTIEYYLHRTSHGSTLSRVVHSWVLARSDRARSWSLFCDALRSDIDDIQGGTTPEGIHLGSMAGAVDILTRGYTGMEPRDEVLRFNPRLPDELARLHQHIHYRGHALEVDITRQVLDVRALRSQEPPIRIGLGEEEYELEAGSRVRIPLDQEGQA